MQNKTKKQIYNESEYDLWIYINGELAIKPYYYYRNGFLHVRYLVDRCYELTKEEADELKKEISYTNNPNDKQAVLAQTRQDCADNPDKEFIKDGITELERRFPHLQKDGKRWRYESSLKLMIISTDTVPEVSGRGIRFIMSGLRRMKGVFIGLPQFALEMDGQFRMANTDEIFEIMDRKNN